MNVNTFDATPMHEEILSTRKRRVFDDGTRTLRYWFELWPDKFTCGDTENQAKQLWEDFTEPRGSTLAFLKETYPHLKDVTDKF